MKEGKRFTCERAAGLLRLPLGVPVSGVPLPDGGNWLFMTRASMEEHPGAQMDADRALLQPLNEPSSLIVISRVTKLFFTNCST